MLVFTYNIYFVLVYFNLQPQIPGPALDISHHLARKNVFPFKLFEIDLDARAEDKYSLTVPVFPYSDRGTHWFDSSLGPQTSRHAIPLVSSPCDF